MKEQKLIMPKRSKAPWGSIIGLLLLIQGLVPLAAWGETTSVSHSPAEPLSIVRVEMDFHQNGKGEITVPKNFRGLTAEAKINTNGTGIVVATWELDGRVIGQVRQQVTFGKQVIIPSPVITSPDSDLPISLLTTFEPGLHEVRFRVATSTPSPEIPIITYFVVAAPVPGITELISPEEGTTLPEPQ